jgi:hypothetical protein
MSVWLTLGLFVIALVVVAAAVLVTDVARGDVGGGRHTMARARRLLVVSTDEQTAAGADRWIDEQHADRPHMQFFVLEGPDDQALYEAVHGAIERDRPDAIVIARHEEESHTVLTGLYGRLKEDVPIPVDAIYIPKEPPS